MKRGMSLIESMISLFLSGILILSSNYFIKDMSRVGKSSGEIAENLGEQTVSITYLTKIIREAGEGIEPEIGLEIDDSSVLLRKSVKELILKKEAHKGDNYIITENKGLKKGKKISIGKNLYTIISVEDNKIFLDNSLSKDLSPENTKIKLIKEYKVSYLKNKGVCLKIDRGHYQLISDKFKSLKFGMFNDFTLKIKGYEKQSNEWKKFELYIVIPALAINGGNYERF